MSAREQRFEQLDQILHQIIDDWYERVKGNYVTEQDSRELGVEPEVKLFHNLKNHRIKFSREEELDVTYGLGLLEENGRPVIESSVNNKSAGFDYDLFTNRLKSHYWRSRIEKPWTDPAFDRFTHQDLLLFEPVMGESVTLDIRKDKADIMRLFFEINLEHEDLLLQNPEVLRDLIEDYCLAPLRLIYAESYREQ